MIAPHYPKGKRGRPPVGLERMLRVYLVQQWYGLSDEESRMRSPTAKLCGRLSGSTCRGNRHRMRRRCCSSGTCWRNMN